MTIDEAIGEIENVLSADLLYDESIDYQLTSDDTEWLEMAISALRAQQEAEDMQKSGIFDVRNAMKAVVNDPLTLDELREMDGEPVWVQSPGISKYGRWAIVDGVSDDGTALFLKTILLVMSMGVFGLPTAASRKRNNN